MFETFCRVFFRTAPWMLVIECAYYAVIAWVAGAWPAAAAFVGLGIANAVIGVRLWRGTAAS